MFVKEYSEAVGAVLQQIFSNEAQNIEKAGELVAESLQKNGLLYVFGCGHSHILEEELFYRAGGLAAVSPIFETCAMLHEGAVKSSYVERMSGYAEQVISRYPITENDCLLIVSSSGINPFPIEMAQGAASRGAKVIGISSFFYKTQKSRQAQGLHLPDVCDLCINNYVPVGDASIEVCSDGTKAGPVSTIASAAISNSIVLSACENLRSKGIEPKVFSSGNCPGGDAHNSAVIGEYRDRVRYL